MSDLVALEQRFWDKVWKCGHRMPCKKCCWPWTKFDTSLNWKSLWHRHAICSICVEGTRLVGPAHRIAYEFHYGPISFRGHRFHFCHQCHFAPCCNPIHILPGSASDNAKDRVRLQKNRESIRLPDGRIWSYEEACQNECYFTEALEYQRVWAGEIPSYKKRREQSLSQEPTKRLEWPRIWPGPTLKNVVKPRLFIHVTPQPEPERWIYRPELEAIQYDATELMKRHKITLEQLYRFTMLDLDQFYKPVNVP